MRLIIIAEIYIMTYNLIFEFHHIFKEFYTKIQYIKLSGLALTLHFLTIQTVS